MKMDISTLSKQKLKLKSNELQTRLDKIIAIIVREFDPESEESTTQLKKARTLCDDLKNLEPAINKLEQ